ncbi:unnamed protein product [Mytilus coruscus]|uniref:Uncharacterized protein n=1 Tax=Mytilus coruscus TaxID=42192 RepID=A0A6J8CMN4_MYTCO|nr:unnamed protein product [Mytilus coruscus]
MRCKYHFDNGSHLYNRHPFLSKSGYKPNWANNAIENYLFSTRIELEKIQIKSFKDNLPKNERKALQSLRSNDHIIIKKADKNSSTVVLDKELYIKMANDQLNDNVHYERINESHTTEVLDNNGVLLVSSCHADGSLTGHGVKDRLRPKKDLPPVHLKTTSPVIPTSIQFLRGKLMTPYNHLV